MTRSGRHGVLAALLLLFTLAIGCGGTDGQRNSSVRTDGRPTGATGPNAQHGLACGPSWSTVPSAEELLNPRAIAAIAKNDIWVVGSTTLLTDSLALGTEHWDGSTWSRSPIPDVGDSTSALNGVDALASEDVWAVGYSHNRKRRETLVVSWDGTQWRVVESPNVGDKAYNTLTSVDALSSTEAWAVGSYWTPASRKTLIQRWDGTSWKIVSSPNPATLSNSLLGVAAAGSNDIWVVGWKSGGDGLRSLLLHHDGTRWVEVAVPAVGSGDNVLTGISAASGNDVWATGYYVDGTEYKTLTLHYDGSAWSRVPSPNGGDGTSILRGVGAFSPTNAWAVGFEYRAALHHYVASTQHWDGSTWSSVPSAISRYGRRDSEMFSVAKAPRASRVWAVGQPAIVESICQSENQAAMVPAQEVNNRPTTSSIQAPEQQGPISAESSASSASAAPTSGGIPVKAVDKAADAGISEITRTYGAVVADFNNDQRPDIFLGRHLRLPRFYFNEGSAHFAETNEGAFVETDRHGCAAADVNGDGLQDLFCSTGAERGTTAKRNELYVQQPDHTFADRAGQYGVFDPFGRGRLSTFIDANGDDYPDLFVANEATRGDGMPSTNRFFINEGGDRYRHAPGYGLDREMKFGVKGSTSVGDLDKDGWEDLVVAAPSGLRVYHNNQGKGFTDVAASVGLGQSPGAATLADVNGDSWQDIIEVTSSKLRVLLNTGGTFSVAFSVTLQGAFSVAAGDVNGDDRPDIYVMRGEDAADTNAPDQIYLNDGDGTGFTRMSSIPTTSEGEADFVSPIDYDQNGLTDFLVLNGGGETSGGPVQLIAFFRTP